MTYCCLVPLSRYPINYTVARGEPFTEIDRFVLRAVRETQDWTLKRLEERFCLPPRLIIEIVVGLAKRGYIGLSGGSQPSLRVTALGHRMMTERRPPAAIKLHDRLSDVFIEKLRGQILLRHELTFATQRSLAARGVALQAIHLQGGQHIYPPDSGQLHAKLSLLTGIGEWIYAVSVAQAATREPHFLPLDVDPVSGAIVNLPHSWHLLREPILDQLKQMLRTSESLSESSYFRRSPHLDETESVIYMEREAGRWHKAAFEKDKHLLCGNRRHEDHLRYVLTEQAGEGSNILIASAFIDTHHLDKRVRKWILDAVRRGARVELLWGYAAYSERKKEDEAIDWLRKLKEEAKELTGQGELSFNERRTGSHVKLLIHGRGDDFQACIGSYNWLSTKPVEEADPNGCFNISFYTDAPGLLAELCLSAAGLWESSSERGLSSQVQHWRSFAQSLAAREVQDEMMARLATEGTEESDSPAASVGTDSGLLPGQVRLRAIHNYEHESRLRDFLRSYIRRCAVVSHTFNTAGTIRLTRFAGGPDEHRPPPIIRYGESLLTASEMSEMEAIANDAGIRLDEEKHLHAKVAIADDRSMITSYNFLAAQTSASSFELREIGLLIDGSEVADALWETLYERYNAPAEASSGEE